MNRRVRVPLLVLVLFLLSTGLVQAMTSTNFIVNWDSMNSGGVDTGTSTNYKVRDTAGDQATGYGAGTTYQVSAGYRVGDMAYTAPTSTPPPSGGGGGGSPTLTISNVLAINITANSVRITWDTDRPANSTVGFGITTAYASGTVSNSSLVSAHVIDISGLSPNTVYHFYVSSVDGVGYSATTGDYTFTTLSAGPDVTAPIISAVRAESITDTSASILWSTDEAATSFVTYGTTTAYGSTASVSGFVTSHLVPLSGLTEGTTYHYFVTSVDAAGNSATSPDHTFTTTIDTTPPTNVSSLTATPGDTIVTLNWTNPTDADFAGTRIMRTTGGFPAGPFDGALVYNGTGNTTIDSGLINDTEYFYGAYAYDSHGNFASGALASATPTGVPIVPPPPTPTSTPPTPPPVDTPPTSATSTPPGFVPSIGIFPVTFFGAGGTVQLTPDSAGKVGILVSSPVLVRVPASGLDGIPSSVVLTVGSSKYSLALSSDRTAYTGTFLVGSIGLVPATVTVTYSETRAAERSFTLNVQPGGRVVQGSVLGLSEEGVPGATVQLFRNVGGVWDVYGAPQMTGADGSFAYVVPNGTYYAKASKDGYRETSTDPIEVVQNVFNRRIALIELPKIKPLNPDAPLAENAAIIAGNISAQAEFGAQIVREVLQSAPVQAVNSVAAPALLALTLLNAGSAVSFFNLLAYLQYIFTQPLLLFGRRRRKKWGVVFNSLTKLPVDLTIVRLVQADTKLVVQTKVTDRFGRYAFLARPGNYQIEVVKAGFLFPTQYLAGKTEDVDYTDIYHGDKIAVADASQLISPNIPLDPVTSEETPRAVLWRKSARFLQHAFAFSGIPLGILILIVTPSLPGALLLLAQVGIYLLFRRLALPAKAKSWGIVFDADTRQPIEGVIMRIFDKKFNKLLETQVTDKNGKYGFLVRRNVYYVTAEKLGYAKATSPDVDLTTQDEAIVDQNISLQKLAQIIPPQVIHTQ